VGRLIRMRVVTIDNPVCGGVSFKERQQIEVRHSGIAPELAQLGMDWAVVVARAEAVKKWKGHHPEPAAMALDKVPQG